MWYLSIFPGSGNAVRNGACRKATEGPPMRVLFFCADAISGPMRIVTMLEALRSQRKLGSYSVVDRNMAADSSGSSFEVLIAHRNLSKRQYAWLRHNNLPFIYDIDDLLLSNRKDLTGRRAAEQEAIRWCLANAQFVTSPSRRLLATLDHLTENSVSARAIYLPNAGFSAFRPCGTLKPPSLLWVSSHGQNYHEYHEAGAGLAKAAHAIGTDVFLIGHFASAVRATLPDAHHIPWIEPLQFESFLAERPFIAAAPMPIGLPKDEQEFVDCKSDIKAAQYCSIGITGLYSPCVVYRESELPCKLAKSNATLDWEDGMIQCAEDFPAGGYALAQDPAVARRRIDFLAQQLLSMLQTVKEKTGRSFEFRAIATPTVFRRVERRLRSLRSRLFTETT